jgi:type II restriction enzyme
MQDLKGWNLIVYEVIMNNFGSRVFSLNEIYQFEDYFKLYYPNNNFIQDKIRQILQVLRDKGLLEFVNEGYYKLI